MAACSTEKKYDQRYTFRMDILKAIKAMVCKTELLEVKKQKQKEQKKNYNNKTFRKALQWFRRRSLRSSGVPITLLSLNFVF